MTNVVLVDDDRNILTALSILLQDEGFRVTSFADPEQALKSLPRLTPDLAILDLKMPKIDGFELLKKIRETSRVPVMFLTSQDSEVEHVVGLRMGADDFLSKPFSPRILLERVKACLRRSAPEVQDTQAEEPILEQGPLRMDPNCHEVTWFEKPVQITATEFRILTFLAEKPGFVRSRQQIMDVAYGESIYVSDRSIDSQIKRLRAKFRNADQKFDAIETVYSLGYKFVLPE